jgi:hypothetical protein
MFRRWSVLAVPAGADSGLDLRRLQNLVLSQQVINCYSQEHRPRYAGIGSQLLQQFKLVMVQVKGLDGAFCLTHS